MENSNLPVFRSAGEIHNKRVYDASGNDCGHLSSLLFDSRDSMVLFALISLEGDVASNGTTAIPWNSVRFNPNTGYATLHINKELLRGAPRFEKSDFKLSNKNVFVELLKYYGYANPQSNINSPTNHDTQDGYHQQYEGEEYSDDSPLGDQQGNSMGEELDYDKLKGLDTRVN